MEALAPFGRAIADEAAPLRIGVFADAARQPRWIADALARVAASGVARVTVFAEAGARGAGRPWLWTAYERLDRTAFASGPDATEGVELATAVPMPRPLVFPRTPADAESFRAAVAAMELDVAFALGGIDDRLLDGLARHGTWRFGFGEGLASRAPGLTEILSDDPVSCSGLVARRADGSRQVLCRSYSRTVAWSVGASRDALLRKAAQFPLRALRSLGAERAEPEAPARTITADVNCDSGPGLGLASIAGMGARVARRAVQKATTIEQWFVAFAFGEAGADPADLEGFVRLMPPKDRYWADPFPVVRGGRCYIFFEELVFAAGKAHLSVVEVDRAGRVSEARKVLETDYHLSYPFLIDWAGELYMIPETAQANRIEAWRCVEFPHRWAPAKVLIDDIRAVDATFTREGDRVWMFANVAPPGACLDDELHLFHADHLLGEYTPHPMNPVVSDARRARPAGRIYRKDGALIRPSQVCVPHYGAALALNRVERLDPLAYAETCVETIVPRRPDDLLGLHTINRAGDFCVVDGFVRTPRFGR